MRTLVFLTSLLLSVTLNAAQGGVAYKPNVFKVNNVAKGSVKLHKFPTVHSPTLAKLGRSTKWVVKKKGFKAFKHSRWQKVEWNGKRGWIQRKYISLDKKATMMARRDRTCLQRKLRSKTCKNRFKKSFPSYF